MYMYVIVLEIFSSGGKSSGPTMTLRSNPGQSLGGEEMTSTDVRELNYFYRCTNSDVPIRDPNRGTKSG